MDKSGDVLQGAQVTLMGPSLSNTRTVMSDRDGQFAFTDLPPGTYGITATGAGMSTFTSNEIPLQAGEVHMMSGQRIASR
jgi:uncharacterized surface anchored protein